MRLAGKDIGMAAAEARVSRATGYRFERMRVGTVRVSGFGDDQVVATSTRVKVAGKRERELVQLWLDGKDYYDIGYKLSMSWQGVEKALRRLWMSKRWSGILDGLESMPPPKESIVRRCPECGYVQSYMNCCRCSRPGKRGRKVATIAKEEKS
jgi:hypothetical protein